MKRVVLSAKETDIQDYYETGQYSREQLYELEKGIQNGLDTSLYDDSRLGWPLMEMIRKCMQKGVDTATLTSYVDEYLSDIDAFGPFNFEEILQGLLDGVDTTIYDDTTKYSSDQMRQIRLGLKNGQDVSSYLDPSLTARQMESIRKTGSTKDSWKSLVAKLRSEIRRYENPFYEQADAAYELEQKNDEYRR